MLLIPLPMLTAVAGARLTRCAPAATRSPDPRLSRRPALVRKGRTGDLTALRTVWQRGQRLWISSLALTAAWIVLYVIVVDQDRWSRDLPMTRDLLSRSITHGIVPGLAGGP